MTIGQLGQRVKLQYPQYGSFSDEEVGQRMVQKYPQYQNQITQDQSQSQTASQIQPMEDKVPTSVGEFAGNIGSDIGQNIQGLLSLPGLVLSAAQGQTNLGDIGKQFASGLVNEYKNLLPVSMKNIKQETGLPLDINVPTLDMLKSIRHFGAHPVNTLLDIMPLTKLKIPGLGKEPVSTVPSAGPAAEATANLGLENNIGKQLMETGGQPAPAVFEPSGSKLTLSGYQGGGGLTKEQILNMRGKDLVSSPNSALFSTPETSQGPTRLPSMISAPSEVPQGAGLGSVEDLTKNIIGKAESRAAGIPKVGLAEKTFLGMFNGIGQKMANRLKIGEVARDILNYGVEGSYGDMQQTAQKVITALDQVNKQAMSAMGKIEDTTPVDIAQEAMKSVSNNVSKREMGLIRKSVYGADRPTLTTMDQLQSFKAVQDMEKRGSQWLAKDTVSNPNMEAADIGEAYFKASNAVLDALEKKAGETDILSKFKTPQMQDFFDGISKKLGEDWRNAKTFRDMRRIMRPFVRLNQMIGWKQNMATAPQTTTLGRTIAPIVGGAMGSPLGPVGTAAGVGVGQAATPLLESVATKSQEMVTPALVKTIKNIRTPASMSINAVKNLIKTPLAQIAANVKTGGGSDNQGLSDVSTASNQIGGQSGESLSKPQELYSIQNMIADTQRDPKNKQYYMDLYNMLKKESTLTTAQETELRQRGVIKEVNDMITLVPMAKNLGFTGNIMQKITQKGGKGFDMPTLQLMGKLATLRQLVATDLHRRGMSESAINAMSDAFPTPSDPPETWKAKLMNLQSTMMNIFDTTTPVGVDSGGSLPNINQFQVGQ